MLREEVYFVLAVAGFVFSLDSVFCDCGMMSVVLSGRLNVDHSLLQGITKDIFGPKKISLKDIRYLNNYENFNMLCISRVGFFFQVLLGCVCDHCVYGMPFQQCKCSCRYV